MNINLITPVFHTDELYEIALFFILLFRTNSIITDNTVYFFVRRNVT